MGENGVFWGHGGGRRGAMETAASPCSMALCGSLKAFSLHVDVPVAPEQRVMDTLKEISGVLVDEGKKILLLNDRRATEPEIVEQTSNHVDNFLLEALQNPRDRLTILKLEQEILKFLKNPKIQQLEFQPMASSYTRLATHLVAQHYHLKSTVCESGDGTRICVTKPVEGTQIAVPRLADMPTKVAESLEPRVAIKQRPAPAFCREKTDNRKSFKVDSAKSVEERKEEYNKARARIFSEEADEENVRVCCHIEVVRIDNGRVEHDTVKVKETSQEKASGKTDKEKKDKSKVNTNRVAIFRDREKDRKDPDYDRSYDRYSQRYGGPVSMQAMCAPASPNYNPQYEACVRQSAPVQVSWMPPPPTYSPAAATGGGGFNPTPQAAMSFLMHAQQSVYPGPYVTSAQPQAPRFFQPPRYSPQQANYVQGRHY